MSITYARFNDHALARQALAVIRQRIALGGRVELLRNVRRLSHHTIPLRMTATRIGAIVGGIAVGLLSVLTVASAIWVGTSDGLPIPAPIETLVLCIVLSTVLGGLAGALSFASDNGAACQRVRGWLRGGSEVVLVDSPRSHEDTLRHLGAAQVGKLF